jgi:hypothetical protein
MAKDVSEAAAPDTAFDAMLASWSNNHDILLGAELHSPTSTT